MQLTETPSTDAAAADVITSPEAAARKCPKCEALMTPEEMTITKDDGTEERVPSFACTSCDHEEQAYVDELAAAKATETPAPIQKSMRCERCSGQILISPLPSGHGFRVLAIEHLAPGFDMEATFGVSANGFPICPKDGVGMLPVGPVPVEEAFRGIQDALKPADGAAQMRLPHTAPPFNVAEALDSIERKHHDVESAKRTYEHKKEQAANAKKDYDARVDELGRLITEIETRRQEHEAAARGRLRPAQDSPCLYEQRAGKACPTCRAEMAKSKEQDPEANLAHVSLRRHLEHRGFYLEMSELLGVVDRDQFMTGEGKSDIQRLAEWAHDETLKFETVPVLAELFTRAHVAAAVGDERQTCTRCGLTLIDGKDIAEGESIYPEGTYVGLDCVGSPGEEQSEEPESARTLPKRHKEPKAARAAKTEKPKKPTAKGGKKRTRSR